MKPRIEETGRWLRIVTLDVIEGQIFVFCLPSSDFRIPSAHCSLLTVH